MYEDFLSFLFKLIIGYCLAYIFLPDQYKCVLKRIGKFYIRLYYSENELVRFLEHARMSHFLLNRGKHVSFGYTGKPIQSYSHG